MHLLHIFRGMLRMECLSQAGTPALSYPRHSLGSGKESASRYMGVEEPSVSWAATPAQPIVVFQKRGTGWPGLVSSEEAGNLDFYVKFPTFLKEQARAKHNTCAC